MLSLCTCNIEDIYHYNICFIRNPIYIFYISMFRTSSSHFRTVSSHLRTVSSATRRLELCLKTVSSHFLTLHGIFKDINASLLDLGHSQGPISIEEASFLHVKTLSPAGSCQ